MADMSELASPWPNTGPNCPPKAELEQTLHTALLEARERLARRGVLLGDLDDE